MKTSLASLVLMLALASLPFAAPSAAQEESDLLAQARAAAISLDELGEGWSVYQEEASDEFQGVAAVYWAIYERDLRMGLLAGGPILVFSGAGTAIEPLVPSLFEGAGSGIIGSFSSGFAPGAEALAEVTGPAIGTNTTWYALVEPELIDVYLVLFQAPAGIGFTGIAGFVGSVSQSDVLPLAETTAARLGWTP